MLELAAGVVSGRGVWVIGIFHTTREAYYCLRKERGEGGGGERSVRTITTHVGWGYYKYVQNKYTTIPFPVFPSLSPSLSHRRSDITKHPHEPLLDVDELGVERLAVQELMPFN